MESASERISQVRERIQKAAQRSGRDPQKIALVAVSKAVPFDRIAPFIQAGMTTLGENRVQEALTKYGNGQAKTLCPDAQLHLIGHLQTNKSRKAVTLFDMVQSLDRIELGDDLNRYAGEAQRQLPCLVEVKISPEPSKQGLAPERLEDFLAEAKRWVHLRICGLMGIAPYGASPEAARPFFRSLRRMFDQSGLDVLSMGMSQDFEVAIEEGATMVRIGTALFGDRSAKASA